MYAHTAKPAKHGKPCDGLRYNALHGSSLDMHEIDMIGVMKREEKKEGARPCGGSLYGIFHSPKRTEQEKKHETRKPDYPAEKTIDGHVESSHTANTKAAENKNGQNHGQNKHYSSQDMFSVGEMLAYTSSQLEASGIYVGFKTFAKGIDGTYSKIEKELREHMENNFDAAYAVAEEVEKKYSKNYIAEEKQKIYQGRTINNPLKKEKSKLESGKKKNNFEKALKKIAKTKEKDYKLKKSSKKPEKRKNEARRRSLPSGPEAIRKRLKRSNRKSRESRFKRSTAKQPKSSKHKKKFADSRKI